MGKGNRNREFKAQERQLEREMAAKKKEQKKKVAKLSGLLAAAVCLLLVVAMVITASINSFIDGGSALRKAVVAKTEHHQVTAAMASYYMYSIYGNFKANNSSYIDTLITDVNKSLKKQPCYYAKEKTWFEYFVEVTSQQIAVYLSYAELASKDGMVISDENLKLIDDSIEELKVTAKNAKMKFSTYLKKQFGRGVNESDLRSALELYYLAMQKRQEIYDSKNLTVEDYNEYVSKNMASFYTASYYEITIEAEYDVDISDQETINNAINAAKAKADAMAKIKNAKDFENAIKNYYIELEYTTEKATSAVTSCTFTDVAYKDSSDLQKWLFSTDRVAGDTNVFKGTEKFTVVYIINPSHKDTTDSRNFKHILLTLDKYDTTAATKAKADEIVASLAGNLTPDTFDAAAKEFSESAQIDYKNITNGSIDTKVGNWLFATERKIGDITVIESGSQNHIIYYTSNGLQVWAQNADDAIRSAYCDEITKELNTKISAAVNISAFDHIVI